MMEEKHCQADIEVDGGVSLNNVQEVLDAGANIIVAGTAVFKGDIRENVESFLNIMENNSSFERPLRLLVIEKFLMMREAKRYEYVDCDRWKY